MIGPNFQRYRVILVYVFVCIPEYSAVFTFYYAAPSLNLELNHSWTSKNQHNF